MHHLKTHLKFKCQCNYIANCQIWVGFDWTGKRMEEGIQINMKESLFRRDTLSVNILKTQVFLNHTL